MIVCVCGVNPCFQGICDFSVFQYFSFSVLRQGVQAANSVLHQRRHWMSAGDIWPDQSDVTCHETISISEFCDSFTAATVLNLSLFKTCLSTTAFSRAKNHKSIWASCSDILSYKCVWGHVILPPAPGLDTWEPLRACFAERWTIALHTDSGLSKPVRVYLSMWYIIYIKIWWYILY